VDGVGEEVVGPLEDLRFGGADVGEEDTGGKGGGDALEHVGELADGGGEDDEVAGGEGLASGDGVGEGFVDGVAVEGGLEGGGVGAADAEDACGELAFFECEAEGGAEETDAEDGDAGEGF